MTVANYDLTTDNLLIQLQYQVDNLIGIVQTNLNQPTAGYNYYAADYHDIFVKFNVITTRVSAIPNNKITLQQLRILKTSLLNLQTRHKQGFTQLSELQNWQKLIDSQFRSVMQVELQKPKLGS